MKRKSYAMEFLPFFLGLLVIALFVGSGLQGGSPTRGDTLGSWTFTGFLGTERTFLATSTLLPNGQVLIVGGQAEQDVTSQGHTNATNSAELYDPSTGAFVETGSLTTARTGHTATLLNNGKVLVTGGIRHGVGHHYESSAELYDPATGTFTPTGSMSTPRAGHRAIRLTNGTVLIAGGTDGQIILPSAELYNPELGLFVATGSMRHARASYSAVLLDTGKVLLAGGAKSLYGKSAHYTAELYDPTLGVFTPTGSMGSARRDFNNNAVLLENGLVLIAGGTDSESNTLSTAELYDPVSQSFMPTGPMTVGRQYHTTTLLPNGHVLVTGGWRNIGGIVLDSAEIYDPATGVFSAIEPMHHGRGIHTAQMLRSGAVLVVGGSKDATFDSLALASSEVFYCPSCAPLPDAPTNLSAEDITAHRGGAIQLSWTASPSISVAEQRIYTSPVPGGPYTLVANIPDNATQTYIDDGLTEGTTYYYVIRAFDGNQESLPSNEVSITPTDLVPPVAPTNFTVADTLHDAGEALTVSWNVSTSLDVTEQRLYQSTNESGPFSLFATFPNNTTSSFVVTGLSNGETYYFVLKAYDGKQEGAPSAMAFGIPRDNTPSAYPSAVTTSEDALVALPLAGRDQDQDSLTFVVTSGPLHGILLGEAPSLFYIPSAHYHGSDTVTFTVHDGNLTSQPAQVSITILPVNDPPTALADTLTVQEDTGLVPLEVLGNDTTVPDIGETLTIVAVGTPDQGGSVAIAGGGQRLLYEPAADFHGIEQFTYTISDGVPGSQATAAVTIEVQPIQNHSPRVHIINLQWEPSQDSGVTAQRVYRGTAPGGPYQIVKTIYDATADSYSDSHVDAGIAYYYVVSAFRGAAESAKSNEVSAVAGLHSVTVPKDGAVAITLSGLDPDGDPLTYVITGAPTHGTLSGSAPNLVYTPNPDFHGPDSFTYTASDGVLTSVADTVTISVTPES